MLDQSYYDKTDEIIAEHGSDQASLIPIIQDIQTEYRYLPPELLNYVAGKLGITEAKAYSVATFYENFSFEPKGRFVIKVCDGTACHVRKSIPILERLRSELGLSPEKATTDGVVRLPSALGMTTASPPSMTATQLLVVPKSIPMILDINQFLQFERLLFFTLIVMI